VFRDAALAALDRIDPDLGAFIEVDRDEVLTSAESPRGGRLSGALVSIKDLIDTAGLRTTYGSEFFADHVPERNAPIVDTLEAEGAIVLGKTNLNEFAYGVSGYNPHYGAILNPLDRSRTAGGSSSGSAAAVAAGVCRVGTRPLALHPAFFGRPLGRGGDREQPVQRSSLLWLAGDTLQGRCHGCPR
jgi:aspartyl-tRNA(Asn)/glutamyl-tRNA(Gln) amidotransferase subunit A